MGHSTTRNVCCIPVVNTGLNLIGICRLREEGIEEVLQQMPKLWSVVPIVGSFNKEDETNVSVSRGVSQWQSGIQVFQRHPIF